MGKLGRLGLEPARRYERERPGELVHVDVKKLGRIQGGAGKRVTAIKRNPKRTRTDRDGRRGARCGSWQLLTRVEDHDRDPPALCEALKELISGIESDELRP